MLFRLKQLPAAGRPDCIAGSGVGGDVFDNTKEAGGSKAAVGGGNDHRGHLGSQENVKGTTDDQKARRTKAVNTTLALLSSLSFLEVIKAN